MEDFDCSLDSLDLTQPLTGREITAVITATIAERAEYVQRIYRLSIDIMETRSTTQHRCSSRLRLVESIGRDATCL